jgi:hypothetical protein
LRKGSGFTLFFLFILTFAENDRVPNFKPIMGSMGKKDPSMFLQHSFRPIAGVNVVLLPTHLKTFLKPRKTLPFFSGSKREALIQDWLEECEKTATILRWTESVMLEEFAKKLSGNARIFHEQILKSVKDYKDWRKLMTDEFFEKDKEFYVGQLINLKQKPDQSVRAFAQEIDSLMVKTMGLAIITDKLHKTFCLNTKLAYFSDGLREDVWTHFGSILLKDRSRIPSWSWIVEASQDAEWLIDLRKKSAYSRTANIPQSAIEDYTKVYITMSEDKEKKLTGYGVFFGDNDSK